MLIYNGPLSDVDRAQVESYLNNKWAFMGGPPSVCVTVSRNNPVESGAVQINVARKDTVGSLPVQLQIGGSATFGQDYTISGLDANGMVTILDGNYTAVATLLPIPDSRVEPDETVTVTVEEIPGSYTVVSPSEETVTIKNDDSNQIPANGWVLTDLGAGAYGVGINTVAGGAGQVVGYKNVGYTIGFKWSNGSSANLQWPSAWGYSSSFWSYGLAINDAETAVGYVGGYNVPGAPQQGYHQRPSYWRIGRNYANELPVLTTVNPLNNAAVDINQRVGDTGGIIVGQCSTVIGKVHAMAWIPDVQGNYGAYTDLRDIGGNSKYSYAAAVNSGGLVVGKSQIVSGNNYHAFRSSQSQDLLPQELFAPTDDMGTATGNDAHTSEGNDINDNGEMVGASTVEVTPGQFQSRAVYKRSGSAKNVGYYDLGVLGTGQDAGNQSVALAIGANGLIVGQSKVKVAGVMVWRAFVASNDGMPGSQPMLNLTEQSWVNLGGNNWQRADLNGWTLISAERVNPAGWIVGYGTKSGQTRAFILAPRQ